MRPLQVDLPKLTDDEAYDFLNDALLKMMSRTDTGLGSGEKGHLYAWYWGYFGRAAVDLYATTGDSRFARLLADTIEALLEDRDDQLGLVDDDRGVVFPGWGTKHPTGDRSNEITTAGLITLPMVEFAHQAGIPWIAEAALETLYAFKGEREEAAGKGYFFNHLNERGIEALNHSALYGAALVHAQRVNGDPWLGETARGIFRYHLSFVDDRGSGISWPYAPTPSQDSSALPSEAIWKASVTIELPVALAENGDRTAADFLQAVAQSLATHPVLLRGEYPQFIGHDRLNVVNPERMRGGITSLIGAFLQIDNEDLREAIFYLMRSHPEMFPRGWRGGARAMIMAWAHLRAAGLV